MPVWRQKYQICPFFMRESDYSITCEGISCDAECVQQFKNPVAKRAHQLSFCETYQFKKCPWAAMLEKEAEEGIADKNKHLHMCNLPGEPCPRSLPRKGMCCAYCGLKGNCPVPHIQCENSPCKCGFSRGFEVAQPKDKEVVEYEGVMGTLFDFL